MHFEFLKEKHSHYTLTGANVLILIGASKWREPSTNHYFSQGPSAIGLPRIHSYIQFLRTEIQHESFTDSAGGPARAWGLAGHWEACDVARTQETSGL